MPTRREFIKSGLAALSLGIAGPKALALRPFFQLPGGAARPNPRPRCAPTGGLAIEQSNPFLEVPANAITTLVDGIPFLREFLGDAFPNDNMPFHAIPDWFHGGGPPEPQESVDVAVVGGGLSGMATAYLLERFRPVVFEPHQQFGGNAAAESWEGIQYPQGSAYVITPDRGSWLENFYHRLGLHRVKRTNFPPDPAVWHGRFEPDQTNLPNLPESERRAFQRYAEVVTYMADNYVDIPLPDDPKEIQRIYALDRQTFRENVEAQMGMPITPILNAAIQGYFYSSFDAGMDFISAAAGWNFVAAEEFGRWIFPGGNGYIAWSLWDKIRSWDRHVDESCRPYHLRARCTVIDVRPRGADLQVTYIDSAGAIRSLTARQVVMAGPKHVMKHVLFDLENWDAAKYTALRRVETRPYLVANVLIEHPIATDFYDTFMLNDENFPADDTAYMARQQVCDMLRGDFAQISNHRAVLTLYHPLPSASARFRLLLDNPWDNYTARLAPQIRTMLDILNVPVSAVRQVRMARWGHAMPIPAPDFIADGIADAARRSMEDRVHFVNQDNFALPAVENSLLEAKRVADDITRLLH